MTTMYEAPKYEITGQFVALPHKPHDAGIEYTEPVWTGASYPDELDIELARIRALNGAAKIDAMEDVHFIQGVLPVQEGLGVRPELTILRNRTIKGKQLSEVVGKLIATSHGEHTNSEN